jgi:hypothetical protein
MRKGRGSEAGVASGAHESGFGLQSSHWSHMLTEFSHSKSSSTRKHHDQGVLMQSGGNGCS